MRELDVSLSAELAQGGLPLLPTREEAWWRARCLPDRTAYRHWHSIAAHFLGGSSEMAAGFIIFHATPKRKRKRGTNFVEIFWLAVDPRSRRRGVGAALLQEVRRHPVSTLIAAEHRLHVMTGNQGAISLYEKMGFKTIATKKGYPAAEYTSFRMAWTHGADSQQSGEQAQAPTVRNFWRTLAVCRPSTKGKDAVTAKRMMDEWKARHKALGYVNGRSFGHWKDGRMGGTWVRVDPKTKQILPALPS